VLRSEGDRAKALEELMRSYQKELRRSFEDATRFDHNGLRGGKREEGVRKFLTEQLPQRLRVVTGQAVDRFGNRSGQLDVMIYDASINPAFMADEAHLLPAEALLAIVEVKTELSVAEWQKIASSVGKIRQLMPYGKRFTTQRKQGRNADDRLPRCHYSVFSFRTNISHSDGWLEKEWKRSSTALGHINKRHIDRAIVLNRGLFHFPSSRGLASPDESENLLEWFVGLANFLNRETSRRVPMDWQHYAGRPARHWKQFSD
jgi:hypothetical protein